jgi:DNA-binding PadR family transcriptional regulator
MEYQMALRFGLLGLLEYGPQSGYDLAKAFRRSLAYFWAASPSQVYRELAALAAAGLVRSEAAGSRLSGRPPKKLYSLTAAGRAALDAWRSSPLPEERTRSSFLLRVFFAGGRSGEGARALLQAFARRAEADLAALADADAAVAEYGAAVADPSVAEGWRLTADFGKRYRKLCRDWAEAALAGLAKDGTHA